MAKYLKEEFARANASTNSINDAIVNNLSINNMPGYIQDFVNEAKTKLEGKALRIIISRIEAYESVLKFITRESNEIIAETKIACNSVIDKFTNEFDELSDESIKEIEELINRQKILKQQALSRIEEAKKIILIGKLFDNSAKEFENGTTKYDKEIAKQNKYLERMKEALDNVRRTDENEANMLSDKSKALNDIKGNMQIQAKLY